MNITGNVSLPGIILLLVGVLALWTATDNAVRALADGANLRRAGVNGSRRRTASWSARNEILIAVVSFLFISRIVANMMLSEGEELAGELIGRISLLIGGAYLVVATWNKYDRRRLLADYNRETAQTKRVIVEALITTPPVDAHEAQIQAEAIVAEVHRDKEGEDAGGVTASELARPIQVEIVQPEGAAVPVELATPVPVEVQPSAPDAPDDTSYRTHQRKRRDR